VQAFDELLVNAQDVLSYKWRQLLRELGAKDDLTSQQKAIEQYLDVLARARGSASVDPLRWGAILTRVSRLTEIPAQELNRRFRTTRKPAARPLAAAPTEEPDQSQETVFRPVTAMDRAERWLLGALLAQPSRWSDVQRSVQPADFTDELRRKLAQVIWAHQRDEGEPTFSELLGLLEDPAARGLAVSLVDEVEAFSDLDQMLSDALLHMGQAQRRQDEKKLVADLRRTSETPRPAEDEVAMLRKLQERARQPDIRRAPT
jgi:hypothetical protein